MPTAISNGRDFTPWGPSTGNGEKQVQGDEWELSVYHCLSAHHVMPSSSRRAKRGAEASVSEKCGERREIMKG